MLTRYLRLLPLPALLLLAAAKASAEPMRVMQVKVAKLGTPVATLEHVRMQLRWADHAAQGELQLWVGKVDAPGLGYHYRDLHWRCPLRRLRGDGWQCAGDLRSGRLPPLQLAVQWEAARTHASLGQGQANIALERTAASPDVTTVLLRQVPLAWTQALLAQAWPAAHFKAGAMDGDVRIEAGASAPLRVHGRLQLHKAGLETADASIVGEQLNGVLRLDYRNARARSSVEVVGALHGGEFLVGNTYVALPASPVQFQLQAQQRAGEGWQLPNIAWRDGQALIASAQAALTPDGGVQSLQVQVRSEDLTPLKPRYLSAWMGMFGLGDVELHGGVEIDAQMTGNGVASMVAKLHDVALRDPNARFVFDGVRGDLQFSTGAAVDSRLQWRSGQLYGLAFGAATLPLTSSQGELRTRADVQVPMLGGRLDLRDVVIRPAQSGVPAEVRFGMQLEAIDFGQVSKSLGLPAFQGQLGGRLPLVRYRNDRVDFDGGLALQLFDGRVAFSELSLERPFGTAPSLSADIAMDNLDLQGLTEVLGFGSISGRLDGRIQQLRLVDWSPVAFDARFITDDAPGVRTRISQRAVQDISKVGGGGLLQSLQGKAISLFKDFGYRQIGIGCKLENQICAMSGLHSAGNAFTIVEGAGVPRLTVMGYNRAVDWPTLIERLMAASKGDVSPVID